MLSTHFTRVHWGSQMFWKRPLAIPGFLEARLAATNLKMICPPPLHSLPRLGVLSSCFPRYSEHDKLDPSKTDMAPLSSLLLEQKDIPAQPRDGSILAEAPLLEG